MRAGGSRRSSARTRSSTPSPSCAGATSSDVSGLTTRSVAGTTRRLVLRWYRAGPAAIGEPLAVAREAAALRALAGSGVPAPVLIATLDDEPSTAAGVLMSELPGRPRFDLPDPAAVRDVLGAIHAVDPGRWLATATVATTRTLGWTARFGGRTGRRGNAQRSDVDRPPDRARALHPPRLPPGQHVVGRGTPGRRRRLGRCVRRSSRDRWRALQAQPGAALGSGAGRRCPAWRPGLGHRGGVRLLDWDGDANDRWPGAIPSALVAMGAPPVDAATSRRRLETFVRRALARLG